MSKDCDPQSCVEKLNSVLSLVSKLIDPMSQALSEIEKSTKELSRSTHNRYLMLLVTGILSFLVMGSMLYVLSEMNRVVSKMDLIESQLLISRMELKVNEIQLDKLTRLASETASTPEIRDRLDRIIRIKEDPTREDVQGLLQVLNKVNEDPIVNKVFSVYDGKTE